MLIFASCVSLSSCSNDVEDNDDGPKSVDFTQKVSLYVGESSSLPNREDSCVWVSDKPLVANVENRTIVANKVGFTIIKAHKSACEITYIPYANSRSTSYEQLIYKTNRLFEQCKPTIQ